MIALIDGDIVAYRAAASAETEAEPWIAISRIDSTMNQILEQTNAHNYQCFVGHKNNFRKDLDPTYKANRLDKPKPKWLTECKEHLSNFWNSINSDGLEADDLLGINQGKNTIICSIDKDLMMIPGFHWNWVTGVEKYITDIEGYRNFYKQFLIGDKSDNIVGVEGLGVKRAGYLLDGIDDIDEMFNIVRSKYNNDSRMLLNGKLLWILQQEGQIWTHPSLPESLLSIGQKTYKPEEEVELKSTN